MNAKIASRHFPKTFFISLSIILLLILSVTFLWTGARNTSQSEAPMIAGVSFQGEYKIGDGEWQTFAEGVHIPANLGDVTLRGIFLMHNPVTGEAIGPLSASSTVYFYLNHIGGTVILPSGGKFAFDAENEIIGEDACAEMWGSVPSTGEEPITIVLHNPHQYGNSNAIDEFFAHMSIAPGTFLENMMLKLGATERNIGIVILLISTVILGISAFSTVIRIKYSKIMWLIGLMAFFAGGYFLFDSFAVSMWNEPYIFNTRVLGLCMMFYILFCMMLVVTQLESKAKKIGICCVSVSAISAVACIAISFGKNIKFYDTWLWWVASSAVLALVLIICQLIGFRESSKAKKIFRMVGITTLITFLLDAVATGAGWWEGGFVSKIVFLINLIMALILVLRIIPANINAAIKARELEAEKQALKLELQESRISIMLSQMRPHFIFNTLNTIYHLCEIDPEIARSTINSFSTYLRNNIDNLDHSEMIHFDKEMSFVKTYLDIEKVRFDDELQIIFDTEVTNFKLPVLTVQPIVENAVKHGTSKKEGISELRISTRECDTCYEIEIRDTGVGFDIRQLSEDGQKHIGIGNVRQRLKHLCNGTLTIESKIGEGTVAIIQIPKKEEENT